MKEDMLEVLFYLFENYIVDGIEWDTGHTEIEEELLGAGFESKEIDKAFQWLEDLLVVCEQDSITLFNNQNVNLIRHYSDDEVSRLGDQGRALITRLVYSGVLDLNSREMVIDRVMALDSHHVNIDHIKWVVLMVLSNQPGFDDIAEWAETVVGEGAAFVVH